MEPRKLDSLSTALKILAAFALIGAGAPMFFGGNPPAKVENFHYTELRSYDRGEFMVNERGYDGKGIVGIKGTVHNIWVDTNYPQLARPHDVKIVVEFSDGYKNVVATRDATMNIPATGSVDFDLSIPSSLVNLEESGSHWYSYLDVKKID